MPVCGTRRDDTHLAGDSYRKNALYPYAKAFAETAKLIQAQESCDIFSEPVKTFRNTPSKAMMKSFFMENMVNKDDPTKDSVDLDDEETMAENQFLNDIEAMKEHGFPQDFAPLVGMSLPIHKLILMNNVFDKGGIQKCTAVEPDFTISMERRILVAPDGTEYDMYLEQNMIAKVMDDSNPTKDIELTLPVTEELDIIATHFGGTSMDALDVSTYISAVEVEDMQFDIGDTLPNENGVIVKRGGEEATEKKVMNAWFPTDIRFTPNYGGPNHFDRATTQPLTITYKDGKNGGEITTFKAVITGSMNQSRFNIADLSGKIKKIRLTAKLDSSNFMQETPTTKWKQDHDYVEIGTSNPISTTISPVEVKDTAAMYHVNTMTKHMSMFKTVLADYKDSTIKKELDKSYQMLDERSGFYDEFDFQPRYQYGLDPVTYRQTTFMDFLDHFATDLIRVLRDPNMTFTVFGDPEVIRRVTPKEYAYTTPASIGPVTLDYKQTIVNVSDKRVYNFIGSDRMENSNEMIILINPKNSDRIIYRIYDYQLYVSNEIRGIANPALPNILAFERYKFVAYQPVQGRVKVLNQDKLYSD